MTAEPLTPAQIAGRIRASLHNITSLWDDMVELAGTSPTRDHAQSELTRPEAVANLRREIHHELSVWCDLIRRHFPTTDAPPPSHNMHAICGYLTDHADQLAEAGRRALEGIEDSADAITRFVYGAKKPAIALGPCPLTDCATGTIRATPDTDHEGRPIQRCDTCNEKHTTDEWLTLMHITRKPALTRDEVIRLAHQQFGIRLTPHAVTCLTGKGTLTANKDGHYDLVDTVRYLTVRAAKTAA